MRPILCLYVIIIFKVTCVSCIGLEDSHMENQNHSCVYLEDRPASMLLIDLDDDVLDRIESHLPSIAAWRQVRRVRWTHRTICREARHMLQTRMPRRSRKLCAHCSQQCVTELTWNNHRIPWVPFCIAHAPDWFLDSVVLCCTGGLEPDAASSLLSGSSLSLDSS